MELSTAILAWTSLAIVVAVLPGPDVLLVLGHAARGGQRAGLLAVAGTTTGGLWYMLLCGFGFLGILTASPTLYAVVKTGGALYLAYLGFNLIRGAIVPPVKSDTRRELSTPFRQGLLTNLLNPKVALFYLAALPQFVGHGPAAPYIGMGLIAIHYAVGGIWLSLLALGMGRASGLVKATRAWRWAEGFLGAAFMGLAGKLALERN